MAKIQDQFEVLRKIMQYFNLQKKKLTFWFYLLKITSHSVEILF